MKVSEMGPRTSVQLAYMTTLFPDICYASVSRCSFTLHAVRTMAKTPFKRRLRSISQDETKGKQVDIIQVRPRRRAGPEEEAGLEEEEA